jgi:signal peptidase I
MEEQSIKAVVRDILETALLTLIIFLGVRLGVQTFRVEGFSMTPTLQTNQYLLINKLAYTVGEPQRGDVVVLRFPLDPQRDFVKRIIALPGEQVEVRGGVVYVDGWPLAEPYILSRPAYSFPPHQVPPDSYFVLGDNRNNSSDSHVWGFLPKDYLIGKAWLSYWPVDNWGVVEHDAVHFATAVPERESRQAQRAVPVHGATR